MSSQALSSAETIVVGLYLLSLLLIGYFARRASKESSLDDFYLAGSSLGLLSLFFTLYATQYSGNSLFALPGKAYRDGFAAGAFIFGVMGIVLVYSLFAPQLQRLARQHRFITVGDFVMWRYQSQPMRNMVNLVLALVLISFILGNLKAVGLLVQTSTGGAVSATWGIVGIALVMAVYESIGGMRGVIWTDVLQGLLLLFTCLLIFFVLAATQDSGVIAEPRLFIGEVKQVVSDTRTSISFVSLVLLIAFGASVYPQAIQRIYAARDVVTLRRSYRIMLVMPLFTTLPILLIGMSAATWFPELDRAGSENVMLLSINRLITELPGWSWLRVLFLSAAIAAIMSTIDSALLSLGSIISKDIVLSHRQLSSTEAHLFSRRLSWLLIFVMAILAIVLPQTIWALLVLKLELLLQVAPIILLGVIKPDFPTRPLFIGLCAGAVSCVFMKGSTLLGLPPLDMPLGVHAGLWALTLNLTVIKLTK